MLSESMDTIVRIGALDIGEITEVRRVLEIPAAEWAARNRSEDDIATMKDVIEKQKSISLDDPDIPEYDRRFHTAIGYASGNRLLAAFIASVHDATHPAQFLDVTPEVAQKTVRQHIAIEAAIEAGDAKKAGVAMRQHLDFVLRYSLPC